MEICSKEHEGQANGAPRGEVQLKKSFTIAIAVLGGLAAGCRGNEFLTTLRVRPQTLFILRTVQGNPLPALSHADSWSNRFVADTLTLRNDGTGVQHGRSLHRNGKDGVDSTLHLSRRLVYTLDGARITVRFPCGGCLSTNVEADLSGEVTRDGIRFDQSAYFRVPLVYEKRR